MYFSGQGRVYLAPLDASDNPGAMRFLGNVSGLKVSPKTTTTEHKESTSGQRLTDLRLVTEKAVDVELTLDEWLIENLALALYGKSATLAEATVTAEALPADLVKGDYVRLAHPGVSTLVISDSATSPATLTADTDYKSVNAAAGTIEIIGDLSEYTQPLTAAYAAAGGGQNVTMFTEAAATRWLRFEGLNTANSDAPMLGELYRVQFDPLSDADFISNDLSMLTLSGSALYDASRVADSTLGAFGRILQLPAV